MAYSIIIERYDNHDQRKRITKVRADGSVKNFWFSNLFHGRGGYGAHEFFDGFELGSCGHEQ